MWNVHLIIAAIALMLSHGCTAAPVEQQITIEVHETHVVHDGTIVTMSELPSYLNDMPQHRRETVVMLVPRVSRSQWDSMVYVFNSLIKAGFTKLDADRSEIPE